ncbi:MAG: metallophosphoesterase [Bacteroidales bacterium]|nr:metallophosphoesterase [Bacteroidales bacterium]
MFTPRIFGISAITLFLLFSCQNEKTETIQKQIPGFTFVFMTDIHLQPELNAPAGFKQAIDSINRINPDFVITGGDLIMDALGQSYNRADSLYKLYDSMLAFFNMPVYNTIGNHEIFGIYDESEVESSHPEFGEKMYENRIGKRYYSFDHKGWHFMILDGIEDTGESSYVGLIDSTQIEWIREDLSKVERETPVVVSIHIPLLTVLTQRVKGALEPNGKGTVVNNAKEVTALFAGHNLRLVLQGHLHYVEDIFVEGTHFLTGGAVSARWWGGAYRGMEEGFVVVNVEGDDFTWKYFDFGWNAEMPENF